MHQGWLDDAHPLTHTVPALRPRDSVLTTSTSLAQTPVDSNTKKVIQGHKAAQRRIAINTTAWW